MRDASIAERLVPILEPLQDAIAGKPWRVVPSSFAPADPSLRALPLPMEWRWPSLAVALRALGVKTLILQQPGFWQAEPLAFYAARECSIPVCSIEPENYPLDRAAMRFGGADGILAEAAEAAAAARYLRAGNAPLLRAWVLIHAADAPAWETPASLAGTGARVAHEVHLAPGVPLLVQCAHLAQESAPRFHRSDIFTWSDEADAPAVTAKSLPFNLADFPLPLALKDEGLCKCGERVVSRA